jgi:hemolysin activation/secretion protein
VLPPLRLPDEPDTLGLARGRRVHARAYRFTGNTAITTEELESLAKPYTNREVSFDELAELRDRLTLAYVERGYVTSGAEIPDQRIVDGIVEVRVVEGALADVRVQSDGRFRASYFERRLARAAGRPVDVNTLEERLQLFQKDPRIASVQARLVPDERRGESLLEVHVLESRPYRVRSGFDNYQSPTVGAEGGWGHFAFDNALGWGDYFDVSYRGTWGLHDVAARYEIPFTVHDTAFGVHVRHAWSRVIEEPFDELDIESESATYSVSLRQPLHRSAATDLSVFLVGEWRRSQSFLLGRGFAFTAGPNANGVSKVAVLRLGQEWSYSGRRQALAARSLLSFGSSSAPPRTRATSRTAGTSRGWGRYRPRGASPSWTSSSWRAPISSSPTPPC